MNLSLNFTLEELCASSTAKRLGIENVPPQNVVINLRALCRNVLQPLRKAWGSPIIVTSGYRCKRLNDAVKGASNSDHLYGCAADIRTVSDLPADNKRLFDCACSLIRKGDITVKQCIDEYGYNWIHISWQDGRTSKMNQILHLG